MSFIYDKTVYGSLIKPFMKEAQTMATEKGPAALPLPADAKTAPVDVAKTFVDRLVKEVEGKPPTPEISVNAATPLTANDMKNFGTFLNYLHTNNVLINGRQVVFIGDEWKKLPEDAKKNLGTLTAPYVRDVGGSRKWGSAQFVVDGLALKALLSQLRDDATSSEKNIPDIFKTYVNTMIWYFNRHFTKMTMEPVKQKVPSTFGGVDDAELLDQIPNKTFNLDNLQSGNSNFTNMDVGSSGNLKAGDIKSAIAFNAWLGDNTAVVVGGKSTYLGNDKAKVQEYKCKIISILIYRAGYLKGNAKSEEEKIKYEYYFDQVRNLSSQFACTSILQPGTGTTPGVTTPGVPGEPGKEGLTPEQRGVLMHLAQPGMLPLSLTEIDLDRIETFVGEYEKFLITAGNAKDRNEVSVYMRLILKYKSTINAQIMKPGITFTDINLQSSPAPFTSGMRHVADFRNLIDYLGAIVLYTSKAVRNLDKRYGKEIPSQRSLLQAQYGSILTANKNKLYQWTHLFRQRELPR